MLIENQKRWFAWRPVRLNTGQWAWLRWVNRRVSLELVYNHRRYACTPTRCVEYWVGL